MNREYIIEHLEVKDFIGTTFTTNPERCSHMHSFQVNFITPLPSLDQTLIQFDSKTKEIKTYTTDYNSIGNYDVEINAVDSEYNVLATHSYTVTVVCGNPTITPSSEDGQTYSYVLGTSETFSLFPFTVDDNDLSVSYELTISPSIPSEAPWITILSSNLGV